MFSGFGSEEKRVQIPESFFATVLPQITNLAELKVTLHVFWRVAAQVGQPRLLSYQELAADAALLAALTAGRNPRPAEEWLREGLELAVARGTLLHLLVQAEDGPAPAESWYLVNTPFNQRWVAQFAGGEHAQAPETLASAQWLALLRAERAAALARLQHEGPLPEATRVRVTRPRPGIFELYEQNIGVITPLLAEQLAEAERVYPAGWIEEAFTEAVNYNKRHWNYIRRILENWAAKGRSDGTRGQDSGRTLDPGKYLTGKYAHLFGRK